MAEEPYPSKGSLSQIALAPAVLGLALMVLGILTIAYWKVVALVLAFLLIVLFGSAVFAVGVGLVLVGLDLWHGVSLLRRSVRIERWRIWPSNRD